MGVTVAAILRPRTSMMSWVPGRASRRRRGHGDGLLQAGRKAAGGDAADLGLAPQHFRAFARGHAAFEHQADPARDAAGIDQRQDAVRAGKAPSPRRRLLMPNRSALTGSTSGVMSCP
jgi:hypothetical protein